MGKTKRRIATAATIAALGGLGAAAYESNPASHATGTALVSAQSHGKPIVTSSSGSPASLPAAQKASASSGVSPRPIVTRTSGGPPGELEDD